jgi:pyrroline-5-carboxylate reductase
MAEQRISDRRIAFFGAGVMGSAFVRGVLREGLFTPNQVTAVDTYQPAINSLRAELGIEVTTDSAAAAEQADLLVLAVKPQVIEDVMNAIRGHVDEADLVLSIAAGVTTERLQTSLGIHRVVRAMPNTPGQIGMGVSVWTAGPGVGEQDRQDAVRLLGALGEEVFVDDESMLDMATALSGTGPAYVFLFMEALIDAGVHMGFSRRIAERLVLQTVRGSVEFAVQSGQHPAQLRNQVTSPGGTTASALYELEKGGLRTVVSRAIWAAYQRSRELGDSSTR